MYYIPIDSETCQLKSNKTIPEFYGAYVNVPANCTQMGLVQLLEENNAEYIFLQGKGKEESYMLHPNGLEIPVFLLNAQHYSFQTYVIEKLYPTTQELVYSKFINLQITFTITTNRKSMIKVLFFYNPGNLVSYDYLREFEAVYSNLREFIHFQPIVNVMNANIGPMNCVSAGRYCFENSGRISGKLVAEESLRQWCIYNSHPMTWFKYMRKFNRKCSRHFKASCSKSVAGKLGIDFNLIEACIKRSYYGNKGDKRIKINIFEHFLTKVRREQPNHIPSFYINNKLYKNKVSPNMITHEVCNHLLYIPQKCYKVEAALPFSEPHSLTSGYISRFLTFMAILFMLSLCCYQYYKRKYAIMMDKEIKKRIDQYYLKNVFQNERFGLK